MTSVSSTNGKTPVRNEPQMFRLAVNVGRLNMKEPLAALQLDRDGVAHCSLLEGIG